MHAVVVMEEAGTEEWILALQMDEGTKNGELGVGMIVEPDES